MINPEPSEPKLRRVDLEVVRRDMLELCDYRFGEKRVFTGGFA